jgi:amino acid adenylation domain-containing protein
VRTEKDPSGDVPIGSIELVLSTLWSKALGCERVGRFDHFFEKGGSTRTAQILISNVQRALDVRLTLATFHSAPTIFELAKHVRARRRFALASMGTADRSRPLPLSFAQQRLWFLSQLGQAGDAYHVPLGLRLTGMLDETALVRALDALVARHEALRTTFIALDGKGFQRIGSADCGFALVRHDLSSMPEARLTELIREEAVATFDLERGPMVRGRLIRVGADEHVLLVTMHHIVSDGWSLGILLRELSALYSAFHRGEADPLAPLPTQYADYAAWQRRWFSTEVLAEQGAYWREILAGAPALLQLPTDRKRPAQQKFDGGFVRLELDATLTKSLKALSQRCGTTLFMTILAAWAVVLSRLSGQHDVLIGTPSANRARSEVEGLIGFFVNTLVLRVDVSGTPTVEELLERVRSVALGALEHQDLPFDEVVKQAHPVRSVAHTPLFQVMFAWQNNEARPIAFPELAIGNSPPPPPMARFDLTLDLAQIDGRIAGNLIYATSLFDAATIERYVGYLRRTLVQMVADSKQVVTALPMLSPEELHRLLVEWNSTVTAHPEERCIHELFEAQVARAPEAKALVYESETLSYGELNGRANRLAHYLLSLGVKPDDRVAICVERSLEMVVGLLGILKAGGAYVPLDPSYPTERLTFMLSDSTPVVVLTHVPARAALAAAMFRLTSPPLTIDLEGERAQWAGQPAENLDSATLGLTSRQLAYVIYTSGSTGAPKGVMVEHRNLARLFSMTDLWFGFGHEDVWSLFHSFAFDFSVWEMWGALLHGGRLVVVAHQTTRTPADFYRLLCDEGVTILNQTPSAFRALVTSQRETNQRHRLRKVIFGGESLDVSVLRPWYQDERNQRVGLINMYGITEATVHVTYRSLDLMDAERPWASPIGRPIRDLRIYLLNEALDLVPQGVVGEIYISGAGVARGYLNRPKLTAERFVANPFVAGDRLYKTGDLAHYLPDGEIEFLGRNDFQVKIRGFRIELGEIEARMIEHPNVREAIVLAREDAPGDKRLVSYYTTVDGEIGPEVLRAHMSIALPEYMVPSAFMMLERFPLTSSGKLDRRAFPAPELGAFARQLYQSPQGEIEEILAGIWEELLGVERVGRLDNFFKLGGHSLLIIQMKERLRRVGLSAEVRRIFETATLAELASALTERGVGEFEVPPNLIPLQCKVITPRMLQLVELEAEHIARIVQAVPGGTANVQDIYPLAPLQEGILFHHLLDERGGDTYVTPIVLSVSSRERLQELIVALQAVIDRHDILRTAILWERLPQPVQVVYRRATLTVNEVVLDQGCTLLEKIEEWIKPERQRLDLRHAPLMRLEIAPDSQSEQWYALLQLHHIIDDHTSLKAVVSETVAHLGGRAQQLPRSAPYRSHVAQALAYARAHDAKAFFHSKLFEIDEPTAPFGLLDVYGDGSHIDEAREDLEFALAQRVRIQAQRLSVTAATLFHAAWALVVSRTSGRDDVVFGSVLLGRFQGSAGAQRVLGMFINTLPLRLQLGERTAKELVEQTQRELVELLTYEQAPLAVAQRCSSILGTAPLFTTLLNYRHSVPDLEVKWADAAGIRALIVRERTNYPITLSVGDTGHGFTLTAQTDRRIDPHRVAGYLHTAVKSLVDALEQAPRTPALRLQILPDGERHQIIELFNATHVVYPQDRLIHELFEEQVQRTPEAPAVIHDEERVSYAELNRRANQLACFLMRHRVGPDCLVGLCVERGVEMIVAVLGILKAGGAYVPLDPSYPAQRLDYMLNDAAPAVILTQARLKERVACASAVIALDSEWGEIAKEPTRNLSREVVRARSGNLAYVIYTSGSTGQPKGIAIEHRNAVNLICWARSSLPREVFEQTLHSTSLNFDLSVYECFVPLTTGGSIRVVQNALALLDQSTGVTLINTVPSAIAGVLDSGNIPETTRVVNLAGEVLKQELVERIFSRSPVELVCNLYGPSETTTYATWISMPRAGGFIDSIGRPIANTQMYILNRYQELVPIGVMGEIYIGGSGVARGYLNRPELTAERFVADPFNPDPQARMYKTGDLGQWRPDGTIEYLGRNDQQVKIRGFRVELAEIEAQLAHHERVKEVVVLAREDVPGERRLVAYVTQHDQSGLSVEELRVHAKAALPEYMVPSAFVILETLPLTPSGKLDRRALPIPEMGAYVGRPYEIPHGAVEEFLAGVWQSLLRVERVGRHDDFFELGGHSLLGIKLIVKIADKFTVQIPISAIFQRPSIREMAQLVERLLSERQQTMVDESVTNLQQTSSSVPTEPPLVPRLSSDLIPLTFTQQAIWHESKSRKRRVRSIGTALRLSGRLNVKILQESFAGLVRRHESLRTTIVTSNGFLEQNIDEAPEYDLEIVDLTEETGTSHREIEASRLVQQLFDQPIDAAVGPLFGATLVKLGEHDHVLAVAMDHIISDGLSLGILFRDIWNMYVQAVRGLCLSLPPMPVQFADYAVWQHSAQSSWIHNHGGYWTERLAGAQLTRLAPKEEESRGGARITFADLPIRLGESLTARLREISRREHTTLVMSVLTAYVALVLRWCDKSDLVVQFVTAGRLRPEVENTIGPFASVLFLRLELHEGDTFLDLLRRVTKECYTACDHDDLGRMNAQMPRPELLLSTGFNWLPEAGNTCISELDCSDDAIQLKRFTFANTESSDEIVETDCDGEPVLFLSDSTEGVTGQVSYRADRFASGAMQRFSQNFQFFAERLVKQPDSCVANLIISD